MRPAVLILFFGRVAPVVHSQLFEALRLATEGEFELVGELDADESWVGYLARAHAGSLAILLLHRIADGEQFDLQVVDSLDGSLAVGKTQCPVCGAAADGWPRFCSACRRDLSGVAADEAVPGDSEEELLQAVREASAGVYEVLGAMRHGEGGGAMYFAREVETGRIAGLVLERETGIDLTLVRSWGADEDALAAPLLVVGESVRQPEADAPSEVEPGTPTAGAPERLAEPRTRRWRPSRRLRYGMAGGVVGALVAALAFLLVLRSPAVVPPAALADTPPRSEAPSSPAPAAVPAAEDRVEPVPPETPPVSEPAPSPSPRQSPRRQEPAPRREAPAPPRQEPSPEADRQRVLGEVDRFAAAFLSREITRVRAAYPGISEGEASGWAAWFADRRTLSGEVVVDQAPEIQGDRATIGFTLRLAYDGQRHAMHFRGMLRRGADGAWSIQELRLPR